jgi:hypothetical protein
LETDHVHYCAYDVEYQHVIKVLASLVSMLIKYGGKNRRSRFDEKEAWKFFSHTLETHAPLLFRRKMHVHAHSIPATKSSCIL